MSTLINADNKYPRKSAWRRRR